MVFILFLYRAVEPDFLIALFGTFFLVIRLRVTVEFSLIVPGQIMRLIKN